MTVGATLIASLLATLSRPATWPLALASFLLRGGFLVVLAPIVVLPSAVGVGNVLTPLLSTFVFHGLTPSIALLAAAVAVGLLGWVVGGGLMAAAAESELVRRVAADDEAWGAGEPAAGIHPSAHPAWRVLTVRLLASLPLLLALSWGAIRIVSVAYRELTVPSDVAVPLVARVVGGASDAVAIVIGAWLLSETVGGLAARRVILSGERVPVALRAAVVRLLRAPARCAALALIPLVPVALALLAAALATSVVWEALRAAMSFDDGAVVVLLLVAGLVALFGGGLALIGVASAWRGAVWTVDLTGTFGSTTYDPEGHWNGAADSGTLGDLRPRGVDPDTR
ncbi:MAG: hypothetical protein QOD78_513 [Chloroflexota bacterium]|nr:hypothetical protein [Chloroflexota bacterium]